jgi:NADH pyrophosphatase NudC (nudix superfamily)
MIEVLKQMVEALENSVDLVIEDAYNAEQLYANVPTRQARVGGLKLLADEHQKAIKAGRQAIADLESQEHNFCPRCGKRIKDLTTIHTCTPPQD